MAELDEGDVHADGGSDKAKLTPEAEEMKREFPEQASKAEKSMEAEFPSTLEAVQAVSAGYSQPPNDNMREHASAGNHNAATPQLPVETPRGNGIAVKGSEQLKKQPTAKAGLPPLVTNVASPILTQNGSKMAARSQAFTVPKSKSAVAQARANEATAPTEWKSWDVEKATRMRKGQKIYQALLPIFL